MVDPNPAAPAMVGLATVSADENPPKKHHYVPVFYQRYFTNDKGLLWVYDRKLKTYNALTGLAYTKVRYLRISHRVRVRLSAREH